MIQKPKDIKIMVTSKVEGQNHNNYKSNLHLITRPVLITWKCIGLFPVAGLFSPLSNKLRFAIKSPYSVICFVSLIGQIGFGVIAFTFLFSGALSVRTIHKFLILGGGAFCSFLTLRLAWNWPKVVQEATAIEKSLPHLKNKNISISSKVATLSIVIGSIADILLSINFYTRIADACAENDLETAYYYTYTMPAAAALISFSPIKFVILQILYYQSVFATIFADLLIITVSMYLTCYMKEFNEILLLNKDKCPGIWGALRIHYTKLSKLCKLIDNNINLFVLYSFGSNLIMICVQLFKVIRKDLAHMFNITCDPKKVEETLSSYDRAFYFGFSLLFLILRAMATGLFAAKVNSTSREPIFIMCYVPSNCFDFETRRFMDQLHGNNIALSGLHFFYVTKSMLLSMVTAIFTYELVMLQFTQK